jgi:predicted metal-dependent hydrolase
VRIKVRRRGGGFESYEHVLKVLLHELCHNEHGPHSASFYKLLDDITQARHTHANTHKHTSTRAELC